MCSGRYQPSIVGFLLEYTGEAPLSPWTYSSLVPDRVLSYSTDQHFDLVILRFGRAEKKFDVLLDSIKTLSTIRIKKIQVFKNIKNSNRLHYLRRVVFPRMATIHHVCIRDWSLKEAAKSFNGMDAFLRCMMENDVTVDAKRWSLVQSYKAKKTIAKYSLQFAT